MALTQVLLDSEGIDAYDQVGTLHSWAAAGYFSMPTASHRLITEGCLQQPRSTVRRRVSAVFEPYMPRHGPPSCQHQSSTTIVRGSCFCFCLQRAQEGVELLSLAVLLASMFVFNQMGPIDEAALDRLSLVTQITKHIRVRATGPAAGEAKALKLMHD